MNWRRGMSRLFGAKQSLRIIIMPCADFLLFRIPEDPEAKGKLMLSSKKITLLGGPMDGLEVGEPPGLSLFIPILPESPGCLIAWEYKLFMDGRFHFVGRSEDFHATTHSD